MRILVLDPRNAGDHTDLFVVDPEAKSVLQMRLGYSAEIHHDSAAGELLVVETEFDQQAPGGARYWLDAYAADSLRLLRRVETPPRVMYSCFPGRSVHVASTSGGRYVYLLEQSLPLKPDGMPADFFRLSPLRYDRATGALESGQASIDSCMIEFGQFGAAADDLFLHLSCEFPSTVALTRFPQPGIQLVRMDNLPPRTHTTRETCGSWFDRYSGYLFCINMEGGIHRVDLARSASVFWTQLEMGESRSIPLQQLYVAGGVVFAGVSVSPDERSLGLASEIWCLSASGASVDRVLRLPFGVMNFVVDPEGRTLYATSPYANALLMMDVVSGEPTGIVTEIGCTPGEVQLLP